MTVSTYIIAEAGVNHNGDEEMAFALVDAASEAGADAVKFQTFKASCLVRPEAPKADYQMKTSDKTETQLDMLRRLELSHDAQKKLLAYCNNKKIDFLSSPFDGESLSFLVDELGLETIKFPSGEITNGPLLLAASQNNGKIILSTGASTLDEVKSALEVLAFGYLNPGIQPAPGTFRVAFADAYGSDDGRKVISKQVTLLHCTSEYPAPAEEANLRAMDSLRDAFATSVGLSDHCNGILVATAAVARGASVLEKHLTLDKSLPGPDHKSSMEPTELRSLVLAIRTIEKSLGSGVKEPAPSEQANRSVIRKSLVAARDIKCGQVITAEHLMPMRPADGVSPMEYWRWLGQIAKFDIERGCSLGDGRPKD